MFMYLTVIYYSIYVTLIIYMPSKIRPNDINFRLVNRLALLSLTPPGSISFIMAATTWRGILIWCLSRKA